MIIAQRDAAGDYVVRQNLPAEELPAIITRNVKAYVTETERVYKKHGKRCVMCNSIYAPIPGGHEVCSTCVELMRIFGPYVHRAFEAERVERNRQMAERLKKLRELQEQDEDEDEEEPI